LAQLINVLANYKLGSSPQGVDREYGRKTKGIVFEAQYLGWLTYRINVEKISLDEADNDFHDITSYPLCWLRRSSVVTPGAS
jgi:hypothetical protein